MSGLPPGTYDLDGALPFIPQYDNENATASLIISPSGKGWVLSRTYREDGEHGEEILVSLRPINNQGGVEQEQTLCAEDHEDDYDLLDQAADRVWASFAKIAEAS